jgi:hypothetical protein
VARQQGHADSKTRGGKSLRPRAQAVGASREPVREDHTDPGPPPLNALL